MKFLVLSGMLVGATSVAAAPEVHETPHFVGTSLMDGGKNELSWRAWFDVSADDVVKRLVAWERADALLENTKNLEVRDRTTHGAKIYFEREAVPFLPNIKMLLDAKVTQKPGATVVRWIQIEGPAESMTREWRVSSVAGGAWVEHSFKIKMPFSPPGFLFEAPATRLSRGVEQTRKEFGAKTVSRAPPVSTTAPSVTPGLTP